MDHTSRFDSLLRQGSSREDALSVLRREGASPLQCIVAIHVTEGVGLVAAKELLYAGPVWSDVSDEALIAEAKALDLDVEG
jgi:hypothetical protein